ncbi:DNA polymerase III subunit epsilon [Rhodobacteraceae bacterium NNCM2]|nr:DNA polymerase III subunit epsilon [Coraliihabitans acroporae]
MREIVLDTETTGLRAEEGHRIVEIGAVELVNLLPTGRVYHQYINPERSMPKEAFDVHGLGDEFLRNQPVFAKIVDAFLDFIGEDSKLVIHNAEFDMRMINAELKWLNRPAIPMSRSIDTIQIARKKFPGAQANLDALCRRFNIDNTAREKHGALLDSELLAEVYLELLGGRQRGLTLEVSETEEEETTTVHAKATRQRPQPLAPRLTEEEREAHAAFVATLKEPLWTRGETKP